MHSPLASSKTMMPAKAAAATSRGHPAQRALSRERVPHRDADHQQQRRLGEEDERVGEDDEQRPDEDVHGEQHGRERGQAAAQGRPGARSLTVSAPSSASRRAPHGPSRRGRRARFSHTRATPWTRLGDRAVSRPPGYAAVP